MDDLYFRLYVHVYLSTCVWYVQLHTFWQSDGLQPHVVTIEFHKRQEVDSIAFYVDYKEDESYTPQKVRQRRRAYNYAGHG